MTSDIGPLFEFAGKRNSLIAKQLQRRIRYKEHTLPVSKGCLTITITIIRMCAGTPTLHVLLPVCVKSSEVLVCLASCTISTGSALNLRTTRTDRVSRCLLHLYMYMCHVRHVHDEC